MTTASAMYRSLISDAGGAVPGDGQPRAARRFSASAAAPRTTQVASARARPPRVVRGVRGFRATARRAMVASDSACSSSTSPGQTALARSSRRLAECTGDRSASLAHSAAVRWKRLLSAGLPADADPSKAAAILIMLLACTPRRLSKPDMPQELRRHDLTPSGPLWKQCMAVLAPLRGSRGWKAVISGATGQNVVAAAVGARTAMRAMGAIT